MNIGVCGRRGEGKTTVSRYLAQRIRRQYRGHAVVYFDPKRSLRSIPSTSDYEELSEIMESGKIEEVAFVPPFSFHSRELPRNEVQEAFVGFTQTLAIEEHMGAREPMRRNLGVMVIVIDEAWLLQDSREMQPHLAGLVRMADKKMVYLIQATHRPSEFSTPYRAQVDELFLFRQWLPTDIETLREWCGDEVAEAVRSLPRHHLIRYEINSGEFQKWDKPELWYRPIEGPSNDAVPSLSAPGNGAETTL